jgi:hypothetical protein
VAPELSTDSRSYPQKLWITSLRCGKVCGGGALGLWINLWITGVESVDKPVERTVDNFRLWITRHLSTIYPQESGTYPQFCPQARCQVFGLNKEDLAGYPHIHRPYYYY